MKLPSLDPRNPMEKGAAKAALIELLQNAHAGEKAAANAYWGHSHSPFVLKKIERQQIYNIYRDELHHRYELAKMLEKFGSKPRLLREIVMWTIGATISFLCLFGGWFIPMYGAGKLESTNIAEYEVAARLALFAGYEDLIDQLLNFAEIEWDHEYYFRQKVYSSFWHSWFFMWEIPPPREEIRKAFANFANALKENS